MTEKKARKTIGADPWKKHTAVAPQPGTPAPADATQRGTARKKTAAAAPQIGAERTFNPPAGKVQLSLRFDPAALERARNACAATGQTFQGMIDTALARECERAEKTNGGKPFPPRAAALKTGPRSGQA